MDQADITIRIKDILQMVKDNKITPAEARESIDKIKTNSVISSSKEPLPDRKTQIAKSTNDVAVIGMSGRFPGASNLEEYWANLMEGKSSVTQVPKERWNIDDYYDPDVDKLDKTNSRWGGFLSDIDKFDPAFFNISGMEAEVMDPQQRLFLEECWKSLEDAGYANDLVSGLSCGVYVGAAPRDYLNNISGQEEDITAQAFWGNTGSVLASRISYLLNLKGPAMALDTACSSSLVALHLACQSIMSEENTMAIAGGVWICTTPHYYIFTSNAGMLSPEGQCKSFDNDANGIVNGEGVGAVVLKNYDQAVKDGDYIYGVIKSSGINQDGKTNGITAPSSLSQTALELEVYKKGNINPETITFLETHGTGTKLGDPIEIEALKNSFKVYTDKKQFCALGSVKTNIGHSSLAAGIASFIKVILAINNKKIPPSLNFKQENEHLELSNSPFYVNTRLKDWVGKEEPLRAGVSSFGFGGTNAHLVIEEYREARKTDYKAPCYLAAFSAKTSEELRQRLKDFLAWSEKHSGTYSMGDISYSLGNRRKHFHKRMAFVVREQSELNEAIKDYLITDYQINEEPGSITDKPLIEENLHNNRNHSSLYEELADISLSPDRYKEILLSFCEAYKNREDLFWSRLYREEEHLKIPLPVYPFARNSYWVKTNERKLMILGKDKLHPLIDENISSFKEQKFRTEISTEDIFTNGCLSDGKSYYPYANFLEIMRKASEISKENKVRYMDNVLFAGSDIFNGREYQLNTYVYPNGDQCQAEIVAFNEEEDFISTQAQLVFESETTESTEPDQADIGILKNECTLDVNKEDFYMFLSGEFNQTYGTNFQVINALSASAKKDRAYAELAMPDHLSFLLPDLVINTFFLESAFQIGLFLIQERKLSHYYPRGFDRLEIHRPFSKTCLVHVVLSGYESGSEEEAWRFTVCFINTEGEIAVEISNYIIIGY